MSGVEFLGIDIAQLKEYIIEIVTALVAVASFAGLCYRYGRRKGNAQDKSRIVELEKKANDLSADLSKYEQRFDKLEQVIGDPKDFWTQSPHSAFDATAHRSEISTSIPIITVVNFKGGVGKTTICSNLAAHFALQGRRILLIDFDYQGSLSDTVLSHARIEKFNFTSQKLIESGHDNAQLRHEAERLSSINSNLWIYPAFYGFSRTEIQMMFRWLVGKDNEIRYNLHNYLQSEPFLPWFDSGFDAVLIDAPPRMLTGSVNALASSTHVLVPTILDGQSHVATLNTLGVIQQFRQKLNKNLKTIGVVPSMVASSTGYNARETHFLEELERQIPLFHTDGPLPILKERPIMKKEELAKAGGAEILYCSQRNDAKAQEIRGMFDNLGAYVSNQVPWRQPERPRVIAMPGNRDGVANENQRIAAGS